jgi:hypothetical protein
LTEDCLDLDIPEKEKHLRKETAVKRLAILKSYNNSAILCGFDVVVKDLKVIIKQFTTLTS